MRLFHNIWVYFPQYLHFLRITLVFPIPFYSHMQYNHSRYTLVCFFMHCTSSSVIMWFRKLSNNLEDVFFMLCFIFRVSGCHAKYTYIAISAIWVSR